MKHIARAAIIAASLALLGGATRLPGDAPHYTSQGDLILPAGYRNWTFLSAGMDMSYTHTPAMANAHMFDNVFAPPAAAAAFLAKGVWPDHTILVLENRGAASKGSINQLGMFQTGEVMALEAHVKDTARFKGAPSAGWGFFSFDRTGPAKLIANSAPCYACHQAHAAADTSFVQFYPTLLPAAIRLRTLSQAYLSDPAGADTAPPIEPAPKSKDDHKPRP